MSSCLHGEDREDGAALILALIVVVALSGIGLGMVAASSTERQVSANARNAAEIGLAADAVVEGVIGDVAAEPNWSPLLSGARVSAFSTGSHQVTTPSRTSLNLDTVTAELQDVARRAFEVCGCSGMARIDFFVTPEDRVVLNEINTIPGFTSNSVYAELFDAIGISYPQLLERLIELALERHADDQTYSY